MRGKGLRTLLTGPLTLVRASIDSLRIIRRRRPNVVLGLGGFASFPGRADGRRQLERRSSLTTPTPWPASRTASSPWRPTACCSDFPRSIRTRRQPTVRRGSAIRCATTSSRCRRRRSASRRATGPLRLLVVGGSLGAQALNARVARRARAHSTRRDDRRSCIRPASAHLEDAARRVRRARRRGGMRAVHRRHGGALRVGRPRRLPRRRVDDRRARRGRPRRDRRAAAWAPSPTSRARMRDSSSMPAARS